MALVYETLMGEDLDLGVSTTSKTAPGGGTLNGTQISISTLGIDGADTQAGSAAWAPGEITGGQSAATTMTVSGATVGDMVLVSHAGMGANNLMLSAHVSSTNTVRIVMSNPTSSAITPTSATLKVLVLRAR